MDIGQILAMTEAALELMPTLTNNESTFRGSYLGSGQAGRRGNEDGGGGKAHAKQNDK
jgi:hypothetical protein